MTEYITFFKNATPLPIILSSWQPILGGFISEEKNITVKPGEQISMFSETGEWSINTYFYDKTIRDEWKAAGLESILGQEIGKISDVRRVNGINNWMYDNNFRIVYDAGIANFLKNN